MRILLVMGDKIIGNKILKSYRRNYVEDSEIVKSTTKYTIDR